MMLLKDQKNAVFSLITAISTWLSLSPGDAFAQSYDNPSYYDLSRQSTEIGWLAGEQYDPRTGHMNHVMTDLEYNGNGLPITITRQIIQGQEQSIDLAFPKLILANNTVNGEASRCGFGSQPDYIVYSDAYT